MGIQVEQLTKNKTCHQKEFIDFEFNGKHVSEFGMVAVFDGDRHSFNASPGFEDETSEVNGVNGQYYWGTRYKARAKAFTLATDGMTEAQINAFKLHFQPGVYGRFIEDKLANRYTMARVSSEVTFSVVPFKTTTTILGQTIEVNEYKGEAKITFVFDDPFYYATEPFVDSLAEANIRAMYINGTPRTASWRDSSKICWIGEGNALNTSGLVSVPSHSTGALTYYNPSVGKTDTKITMTFQPLFSGTNFPIYFNEIADSINSPNSALKCNRIVSYGHNYINDSYFYYTSPNVIFQINRAIQIAYEYAAANSVPNIVDLEELLRLEIVNPKVMGWAASVLRIMDTKPFVSAEGVFTDNTIYVNTIAKNSVNWLQYFNIYMLCMLATCTTNAQGNYHLEAATWNFNPYTVTFDGINSQTTMSYKYNAITANLENYQVVEEKCGDMVCSPYLQLEGGDILDNNGYIDTSHELEFIKGDNDTMMNYHASLYYKYTYL